MKSCMHLLGTAVWLITALGCIHFGLVALGHDPLLMLNMADLSRYVGMAFGLAGVASLAMFFVGGSCEYPTMPHHNKNSNNMNNSPY